MRCFGGLALVVVLASARPGQAAAPADAAAPARPFMARLYVGLENGLALAYAGFDRRLTLELSQGVFPAGNWGWLTELSLSARSAPVGLWAGARVGYQLSIFDYQPAGKHDVSHAADLGALLGLTSDRGSSLALEVGVEEVRRAEAFSCCDGSLLASSRGARLVLTGDLALDAPGQRRRVSLFARFGARFGEHLQEIKTLPLFMAGFAIAF